MTTGTTNTTMRFAWVDGALVLVGYSECCKCDESTEDYVLCPRCGSVKR